MVPVPALPVALPARRRSGLAAGVEERGGGAGGPGGVRLLHGDRPVALDRVRVRTRVVHSGRLRAPDRDPPGRLPSQVDPAGSGGALRRSLRGLPAEGGVAHRPVRTLAPDLAPDQRHRGGRVHDALVLGGRPVLRLRIHAEGARVSGAGDRRADLGVRHLAARTRGAAGDPGDERDARSRSLRAARGRGRPAAERGAAPELPRRRERPDPEHRPGRTHSLREPGLGADPRLHALRAPGPAPG